MSISTFRKPLLQWHERENDRSMPWKNIKDPYKIWLSEIILQQTRVAQGKAYYEKFLEHYPDVHALSDASIDEVLSMWEGLGYYSRARNLHATAQLISKKKGGVFPDTIQGLKELKGVGPYTAAAIGSFAFGIPEPVIDGNSLRVVSRYLGSSAPIDKPEGKNTVRDFLKNSISKNKASEFNQAIMDLGATVCTPSKPDCHHCPLSDNCVAYNEGTTELLPVKSKKLTRKMRYFHFLFLRKGDKVAIDKRIGKDIWQGLFQLPLYETQERGVLSAERLQTEFGLPLDAGIERYASRQQLLTHQKITAYFYGVQLPENYSWKRSIKWVYPKDLDNFGFPKVVRCFLEEKQLTLDIR